MPLAVRFRFDFIDGKGKTSFTKISVPTGFSIAQYVEFGQAMGQLIATISAGQVTGASATVSLDLSTATLKSVISNVSDAGQKGYFKFASAVTGFARKIFLPTFREDMIVAGSDSIDTTDTDVAAFVAAMEDGIVVTGGTISPTDNRSNDLAVLTTAKEMFRARS